MSAEEKSVPQTSDPAAQEDDKAEESEVSENTRRVRFEQWKQQE